MVENARRRDLGLVLVDLEVAALQIVYVARLVVRRMTRRPIRSPDATTAA
jgi:hypothetical protein